jgi:hypothetical protein
MPNITGAAWDISSDFFGALVELPSPRGQVFNYFSSTTVTLSALAIQHVQAH